MRLQPYGDDDLALTRALENDPIVMRHLGGLPVGDRARAVHDKRMAGAAAGDRYRTVFPDGATEPVGIAAIWRSEFQGAPIHELGLMFLPAAHRQGLGLAAGHAIIAELRASGETRELHCFSAVDNVAIRAGAPRLGFSPAGECLLDYEGSPLRCQHWVLDL